MRLEPTLVLASASPRRAELLVAAGFTFDVVPANVDETVRIDEAADAYVARLAEVKARAGLALRPDAIVLGADTVVVVDGAILGKPATAADAIGMLERLQGRAHDVVTGVAVVSQTAVHLSVSRTTVWFSTMDRAEVATYVDSGEPMGKAGAYAIQGRAARYVARIEGSYSNVVGLPLAVVHELVGKITRADR